MVNAADKLLKRIDRVGNPCIVGLDPRIKDPKGKGNEIPKHIVETNIKLYGKTKKAAAESIVDFNTQIIDMIYDMVAAVKPQNAFYEKWGSLGLDALERTIRYAKEKGLVVIEDAKRNDIGSTSEAYADGHLGKVKIDGKILDSIGPDFLTVNPYLGSDGINPFLHVCKEYEKGIFILDKTSNPSSGELQDRKIIGNVNVYQKFCKLINNILSFFHVRYKIKSGMTVYELMAKYIDNWGEEIIGERGYSSIGAVVGATYPKQAEKLRKLMPNAIFLVPGYGAQGAAADDIVPNFNDDGYGAVINSSRGIIFAYSKEPYKSKFSPSEFYLASHQAVKDMITDINSALKRHNKLPKEW